MKVTKKATWTAAYSALLIVAFLALLGCVWMQQQVRPTMEQIYRYIRIMAQEHRYIVFIKLKRLDYQKL